MKIGVKLMGVLKSKTPDGGELELNDEACVLDVLTALDIPTKRVQVVFVNGKPEPNFERSLASDDALTVLAPVGGG